MNPSLNAATWFALAGVAVVGVLGAMGITAAASAGLDAYRARKT